MSGTDDLISMADVARITGQSRSTVGNWKARHADFPAPASRTAKGPLYDRTEIHDWLRRTNRLPGSSATTARTARGAPSNVDSTIDHVAAKVVVLSLRKFCNPAQWDTVIGLAEKLDQNGLDQIVHTVIPFADGMIDWQAEDLSAAELAKMVKQVSRLAPNDAAQVVEELLYRASASESWERHAIQPAFQGVAAVPAAVRALMIGLVNRPRDCGDDEPPPDDARSSSHAVYQAGPGLAQILVEMASGETSYASGFYVQEPTRQGADLARLNMAVHDLAAEVDFGDIFTEDAFAKLRADCVICTPPWDPKIPHLTNTADDPRWVWGEPGPNDGYLAWVQHCLHHLAEGGRAVILLPSNVLFDRGRSARMRRRIVKAGLLEGVISLPAGALPGRTTRGTLLVFHNARTPDDGTVMVDLSFSPDGSSTPNMALSSDLVRQTLDAYRLAGHMPTETLGTEYAYLHEIAAQDFVLDPARYQPLSDSITSVEQLMSKFSSMRYRLESLLATSRMADENLKALLELGS